MGAPHALFFDITESLVSAASMRSAPMRACVHISTSILSVPHKEPGLEIRTPSDVVRGAYESYDNNPIIEGKAA